MCCDCIGYLNDPEIELLMKEYGVQSPGGNDCLVGFGCIKLAKHGQWLVYFN